MSIYSEASAELLEKINSYTKKGEVAKVSKPVEFCGNSYRKVVFNKGFIGSLRRQQHPFLFINEKDEVLDKKTVQKELTKLFYYYDIFFDEDNSISIFKTVKSEIEIKKDENDYSEAIMGLKILEETLRKKEEKQGIQEVLAIVEKVPELRKKNNEKLKEVVKIIKDMKKDERVFNQECLNEIYPVYKEALMFNFKKVKAIYPGGQYYNKLKKMLDKRRRMLSLTFRTRNIAYLIKANYIMGYFEKVINTYSKVIDMNENDYSKFLKEAEVNNVNNQMKFIRS